MQNPCRIRVPRARRIWLGLWGSPPEITPPPPPFWYHSTAQCQSWGKTKVRGKGRVATPDMTWRSWSIANQRGH